MIRVFSYTYFQLVLRRIGDSYTVVKLEYYYLNRRHFIWSKSRKKILSMKTRIRNICLETCAIEISRAYNMCYDYAYVVIYRLEDEFVSQVNEFWGGFTVTRWNRNFLAISAKLCFGFIFMSYVNIMSINNNTNNFIA